MNTFWKAAPWINKVAILLSTAIYTIISIQPLVHPTAAAPTQGLLITSTVGATIFRVVFAGFPLSCAAFLLYCLLSARRTMIGLIFAALLLGIILLVRLYGMEVDASAGESMSLVIPEVILEGITLCAMALEAGYLRRDQAVR